MNRSKRGWRRKGCKVEEVDLVVAVRENRFKMGIQNLLRFLKPYTEAVHIKKYFGKRISPVVVFDGGNLPFKAATEGDRKRRRNANLELAKEKLSQGNTNAAIEYFKKAVSITPSMAHQLIQILRSENVEFIVAPYEADAQLAYLSSIESDQGGIDAVITEDSDLLAYGCPAVIFKMDRYGNGEEILMDRVFSTSSGGLSFQHFDKELFTGMCILAGCDFLPSVPGIGTKSAYTLVSKYRNLDRVISSIKHGKKGSLVPEDYPKSFIKALALFHHARIYDMNTKSLKPMKPLPPKFLQSLDSDLDVLGPEIPPSVAVEIAEGHVDPITMKAFDHIPEAKIPVFIRTVNDFHRDEVEVTSTQKMLKQKTMEDGKLLNEVAALGKLITKADHFQKLESNAAQKREFPDNNPFKKRRTLGDGLADILELLEELM
ncbi:Exonuclease 1 [Acorus calamus]|uniref:Exonuclease 1 n=1 Tax=Acorus calamus TaxID=4465 RepID=A0AAV9F696_ACOCL|nr:Exonuclease 1 [Acorus calamus]